jgi:hypothetical protein
MYDSIRESYLTGAERRDLNYFTNSHTEPIQCTCKVDGSQVTYDRHKFVSDGVTYPHPQTSGLDAGSFIKMYEVWGPAYYSGLVSQVKSNNEDNLIVKDRTDKMFITNDMK